MKYSSGCAGYKTILKSYCNVIITKKKRCLLNINVNADKCHVLINETHNCLLTILIPFCISNYNDFFCKCVDWFVSKRYSYVISPINTSKY